MWLEHLDWWCSERTDCGGRAHSFSCMCMFLSVETNLFQFPFWLNSGFNYSWYMDQTGPDQMLRYMLSYLSSFISICIYPNLYFLKCCKKVLFGNRQIINSIASTLIAILESIGYRWTAIKHRRATANISGDPADIQDLAFFFCAPVICRFSIIDRR